MRQLVRVALDLLVEAFRRKWFLGLFGAITLVLLGLGLSLELDVVDGAIAGSKLFGAVLSDDILMGQSVLQRLTAAVAVTSFYLGALFLTVSCSDFAVELLSPGRIEHLLSLPIARWQLLFGTWLGVVSLAGLGTAYGAVGLTLVLGVKSGLWMWGLVQASALGWVGFCSIYAAMLATTFFVRSAAASSAAGIGTLVLGVVSSTREQIAHVLTPGPQRWLFRAVVMPIPRLADLSVLSSHVAMGLPVAPGTLVQSVAACAVFSAALLAIATWRFERRDF